LPDQLSWSDSAPCNKVASIKVSLCCSVEVSLCCFVEASLYCADASNASFEAIESTPEETTGLVEQTVNLMQTMHTQQRKQRKQQHNMHRKLKYKKKCKVKQITARFSAIYRRGKNRRYKKCNGTIHFMCSSHQLEI
jgi:hypothetical protein